MTQPTIPAKSPPFWINEHFDSARDTRLSSDQA
jgi:hypothetical protein